MVDLLNVVKLTSLQYQVHCATIRYGIIVLMRFGVSRILPSACESSLWPKGRLITTCGLVINSRRWSSWAKFTHIRWFLDRSTAEPHLYFFSVFLCGPPSIFRDTQQASLDKTVWNKVGHDVQNRIAFSNAIVCQMHPDVLDIKVAFVDVEYT